MPNVCPFVVSHDRHVNVLAGESLEQVGCGSPGRDKPDWSDDAAKARIARVRPHVVDHFLEIDVAHDLITILSLAHGKSCVRFHMRRDDGFGGCVRRGEQTHLLDRNHDLLDRQLR